MPLHPRQVSPGPPRPRRAGFSLVEILVAMVVLVLLIGVTYGLFIWTWQGFIKGDDTISSVYDASILLLNLRRDFLRMEFPEGEPADLVVERVGTNPLTAGVDYVASTRQMMPSSSVGALPQTSSATESVRYSFFQRWGNAVHSVSYTYFPGRKMVRRQGGHGSETKEFSMPRLQEFDLRFALQPSNGGAAIAFPLDSLGADLKPSQVWVRAHVRIQSDRKAGEAQKTSIDLATLIFPKRLNALLRSRWQ